MRCGFQRVFKGVADVFHRQAVALGQGFDAVARGMVGLDALRAAFQPPASPSGLPPAVAPTDIALPPGLGGLVERLAATGHGVVMTMGKGGVGKTSVAAAIAVALARRGGKVVLSTTDPAAHVAATLDGAVPGLTVTRIDPRQEVADYTAEVLAKAGKSLDAGGQAMLEEDLRSPCTEEIAVFRAFARTVDEGRDGFVVLDTAPTGHTILLLDAAEAYHREVMRTQGDMPESVRQLLPRLRDPAYTHVLIVTLPEATPVHEAERLQGDLAVTGTALADQRRRAGGGCRDAHRLAGRRGPRVRRRAARCRRASPAQPRSAGGRGRGRACGVVRRRLGRSGLVAAAARAEGGEHAQGANEGGCGEEQLTTPEGGRRTLKR